MEVPQAELRPFGLLQLTPPWREPLPEERPLKKSKTLNNYVLLYISASHKS